MALLCEFHVTFRSTDLGLARLLSTRPKYTLPVQFIVSSVNGTPRPGPHGSPGAPRRVFTSRSRAPLNSMGTAVQPAQLQIGDPRAKERSSSRLAYGRKFETLRTACGKRRVLNSPASDGSTADQGGSLIRHGADDSNVQGVLTRREVIGGVRGANCPLSQWPPS